MNFSALSPNFQMLVLFLLALLPLLFFMKCAAFRGSMEYKGWRWIVLPFPSPESLKRALPLSAGRRLLTRFVTALTVCVCVYWIYCKLLRFRLPPLLLSYLGAIMLWLVSEALGSLVCFIAVPSGKLLPLPHGASPPLAKSLMEFWSRRWNVWTSDWFRQVIFRPLQRRPLTALILVFLVSGILHEWVINVPLYFVTGKNRFGSMLLYFLLQALGILIERRIRNRGVRILLAWLFVFGAAPLIVNEGMLRVLGLWPT